MLVCSEIGARSCRGAWLYDPLTPGGRKQNTLSLSNERTAILKLTHELDSRPLVQECRLGCGQPAQPPLSGLRAPRALSALLPLGICQLSEPLPRGVHNLCGLSTARVAAIVVADEGKRVLQRRLQRLDRLTLRRLA